MKRTPFIMNHNRSFHRRIPVLNIKQYYNDRRAFVEELRAACHNVGFLLIKHDFGDLAQDMLDETRSFFRRPLDDKMRISYENSPSFRGFMKLGVENTSGKLDYREQVEYAVEYNLDNNKDNNNNNNNNNNSAYQGHKSFPVYERLKGRNPWPDDFQPTLKSTTTKYSTEVCAIADIIRDSLCLALKLDPKDTLHDKFFHPTEVPHWVIKLISYPPHESESEQSTQQGVGEHTDTNFLTLLAQDSSTDGVLQAFSQGEWIDVPSSSIDDDINGDSTNSSSTSTSTSTSTSSSSRYLICNLGEQVQTWSNGYFLATPHRVIMRTSSSSSSTTTSDNIPHTPRTSVALFYNPSLAATMGPLNNNTISNLLWERPRDYQQWQRPNNLMIPSVGENTFKSLARSHPKVFARHHKDLEILDDGRIIKRKETNQSI
jgi:isopenicillin N synthase-like dioxygenase